MDPEHTFIRVQERFSQMLTPKIRAALEYIYLFIAITLFCVLVVMHANYVQQPGCSSELSEIETTEAQLIQIKITSAGLWLLNGSGSNVTDVLGVETATTTVEVANVDEDELTFSAANFWLNWIGSNAWKSNLAFKFWKPDSKLLDQVESSGDSQSSKSVADDAVIKINEEELHNFPLSAKETFKAAIVHCGKKWYKRLSFIWRRIIQIFGSFQQIWNLSGIHLNLNVPKWLHILYMDRISTYAVQWLEDRSKVFEPTYLYTMEKGYFLLPESARSQHNIRTVNISISARHFCFGNRLFTNVTTYHGFAFPEVDKVSFTLRETQTRMLKFTVQLQHHARHRLPTFQLIFVHVIESLVFVPIMIGILFFLFEFYDDQLLAFMVLILVWLCELFTLISVRTPISMKFFPRFFLLYFLVFHIYFFSYPYGFSYLALSTTAAFMQHLILYFWNCFEVPALQRFMQNRWSQLQQHPDFHITSSTILASTLHITRLNTRNPGPPNVDMPSGQGWRPAADQAMPTNQAEAPGPERSENNGIDSVGNPTGIPGQTNLRQGETGPNPGTMNSFSSILLWILGGASAEGFNSFLSMFRDVREQGQVYAEPPRPEN